MRLLVAPDATADEVLTGGSVAAMSTILLLAGDDDVLLQRELEGRLAARRDTDPSVDVDVRDVTELERLPELRTSSLFGSAVCLVLRGVEQISGDLKTDLEAYLDDPAPDATVILVARGTGKIQRIARLAKQHGERVDVKRPADWDDAAWIALVTDEFARHDRRADDGAVTALRAHAGTDTTALVSQVATVCAAAPPGTITVEHVEQAVEGRGRASGFAVADAVAERDPARALVALRGALESGEAPLALLGALTFRLRQLLRVRGGASAKDAGMSPGQHRRTQALLRGFGPGELARCHERLAELDLELKGSDLPGELLLEVAVVEIATPGDLARDRSTSA